MENQTLDEYIVGIKEAHKFNFSVVAISDKVTGRPAIIEIRFNPKQCKMKKPYSTMYPEDYISERFFQDKEAPFMYAVPDIVHFNQGAIEIKVLSCSEDYDEKTIVKVLKGIETEYLNVQ